MSNQQQNDSSMKASGCKYGINRDFLPPESLWQTVEPLLPQGKPRFKGGRPPKSDRQMFFAIFYVLRSGIQWNALPRCLGASSTVHLRFQQWVEAGVFRELWTLGLMQSHIEGVLDFGWQSIDGCQTKAPLGGQATGPNPTDRGKSGVKRNLLTDAGGLPIGLVVTGANVHDKTKVEAVLESMPLMPPLPSEEDPQHFCADKGYDYNDIRLLIERYGYTEHIKSRGEEQEALRVPGYRARRWVNERTHSWMNRFRRILIRWEKKVANYEAFLYLVCAFIVWSRCVVFG